MDATSARTSSESAAVPSAKPVAVARKQKAPRPAPRRAWSRWIKRGLLGLVIAAVLGALIYGWMPKPLPVEVAEATRGAMRVAVEEDGMTRVEERHVVRAPISGELGRTTLEAGDKVEANAIVARIFPAASPLLDPRSRETAEARLAAAGAAQRQAEARVAHARAALEFAKNDVRRYEDLAKAGALPKRELEQARLAERTAEAELRAAELGARVALADQAAARASLDGGKADGKPVEVRTPVAGRVLRVHEQSEGLVAAGTPLLELGDLDSLEVVVDVLTRDAVTIEPGDRAILERWGGEPIEGKVKRIEPSAFTRLSALGVEEQRVNVIVAIPSPPKDLGDGFRVEVDIVVWQAEDALRVPASALFREGDGWALFAIESGHAKRRAVKVGQRNGAEAQILEGIEAGARVIVHPSDKVTDGIEVVPEE